MPIPGSSSISQADKVATARAMVLSDEQVRSVDELGRCLAPPSAYPPMPDHGV
jgi:aryl-alcohol dehydrogenase-like predicted oxidoreductase